MRRHQALTHLIFVIQAVLALDSSVCFAADVSEETQTQRQVEIDHLGAGRSPASTFQTVQMKDSDSLFKNVQFKSLFYATGKNDANSALLSKTDKSYISIQHPILKTDFNVLVFGLPDHQQFIQQGGIGLAHSF